MAEFIMTVGEDLLGKPCFIYREEDRVWHMGMYSPHAAHSGGEVKIFRGNDLIHSSVIVDVRFGTALRHVFGKWATQNGYANMKFSDLKNGDVLKLTVPDVDGDPLVLDKWIANRRDLYDRRRLPRHGGASSAVRSGRYQPLFNSACRRFANVSVIPQTWSVTSR